MPRVNFPTIGDIENYEFLRGTIKTIDSSTDTCTVEVDGSVISALLFYHCLPDSQLRANGAIEGSAAGFAEDDQVIVQIKYDKSVARVVAHVDRIKACGYRLKLIREAVPGTSITETLVDESLLTVLAVYKGSPDEYEWVDTSKTYNPDTGYWTVTFNDPSEGNDPDGYWFAFLASSAISTQYPYRYIDSEKRQIADKIKPGTYEVQLPYWKATYVGWQANYLDQDIPPSHVASVDVYSSVPYEVHYYAHNYVHAYEGSGNIDSSEGLVAAEYPQGTARECLEDEWTGSNTPGHELYEMIFSCTGNLRVSGWFSTNSVSAFPTGAIEH